jgi:formate dehydrogenase subunit delta
MEDNKLVSMANQMTTFFRAYPEAEAAAALREHITLFWTPRMRQLLDARIQADTSGVEPLVVRALSSHAPASDGADPISKLASGPVTLGELASDAG